MYGKKKVFFKNFSFYPFAAVVISPTVWYNIIGDEKSPSCPICATPFPSALPITERETYFRIEKHMLTL